MRDKPTLGRGLAALFGEAAPAAASDAEPNLLALDDLEPNPFQPRRVIDDAVLRELAASIREQGVLQPILARRHPQFPGRFQIIAGERRWRAARLADLSHIPGVVRDLSDQAATVAALVENLQRQDLNPIEEAEGFRRLSVTFGLTQEQLAQAIGKSRSHIANLLRLLNLPEEILQHVRDGRLSAGHARAALACPDPAAAARVMLESGLNVRQAEALASARPDEQPGSHTPKPDTADPNMRALEADLSEQLGMRVAISFGSRGGSISIRYRTLDQLDWLVSRLGASR
jgi:ParB family transcriptional regulator, chromosome partitioning protein